MGGFGEGRPVAQFWTGKFEFFSERWAYCVNHSIDGSDGEEQSEGFSWMKCTSSAGDSFIVVDSKMAPTLGGTVLGDQRKLLKAFLKWVGSLKCMPPVVL